MSRFNRAVLSRLGSAVVATLLVLSVQQSSAGAAQLFQVSGYVRDAAGQAINSLLTNYSSWTATSGGWSAEQFWQAIWGKDQSRFDEDYSFAQNYSRVRPPYYAKLNSVTPSNRSRAFHSGVVWTCEDGVSLQNSYAYNSNDGSGSLASYEHFTRTVHTAIDLPFFRVLVHRQNYGSTCAQG